MLGSTHGDAELSTVVIDEANGRSLMLVPVDGVTAPSMLLTDEAIAPPVRAEGLYVCSL